MLTVSKSALETAKSVNGSFVVYIKKTSSCCGPGFVRSLVVELCKNFTDPNNIYSAFQYEGVNVYISRDLKLKDKASIYKKINIPIVGSLFSSKGIIPIDV
jgi:hypothetical protein